MAVVQENTKQLLTIEEACDFLNMKKSRLYYLVFHKQIPTYKIGKSLRFCANELNIWLESKKGGYRG